MIYLTALKIKINNNIEQLVDGVQLFNKILEAGGANKELHDQNGYYHEGAQIRKIIDKLDPKRLFGHLYRAVKEFASNEEILKYLETDGDYSVDHRGAFLVNPKHVEAIVKEWLPDKGVEFVIIHPTHYVFNGDKLIIEYKPQKQNNTKNLLEPVLEAKYKPLSPEVVAVCNKMVEKVSKTSRNKKNAGMAAFKEMQLKLGTPRRDLNKFEELLPQYRKFMKTYGKEDNGKTRN